MLTDISWASYLTCTGTAILIWYITIALLHYYSDVKIFLNGKRKMQFNSIFSESNFTDSPATQDQNIPHKEEIQTPLLQDFEMIEELVERVKDTISEACEKKLLKEDFFAMLSKLLKDYPILLNSQFRPSVNEFIAGECLEQGFEEITIDEVEQLWHK